MIRQCRKCGCITGGLISHTVKIEPWPEYDLCSQCKGSNVSKYTETVQQDTPRLVVMFQRAGNDDKFMWGAMGQIPLLSLIGCITRTG